MRQIRCDFQDLAHHILPSRALLKLSRLAVELVCGVLDSRISHEFRLQILYHIPKYKIGTEVA